MIRYQLDVDDSLRPWTFALYHRSTKYCRIEFPYAPYEVATAADDSHSSARMVHDHAQTRNCTQPLVKNKELIPLQNTIFSDTSFANSYDHSMLSSLEGGCGRGCNYASIGEGSK